METTGKMIRRSIFLFLKNYEFFTTTPALLYLPLSALILLQQALLPAAFAWLKFPSPSTPMDLSGITRIPIGVTASNPTVLLVSLFSTYSLVLCCSLLSQASIYQALKQQENNNITMLSTVSPSSVSLLRAFICNSIFLITVTWTTFSVCFMFSSWVSRVGSCPVLISAVAELVFLCFSTSFVTASYMALVVFGMEDRGAGFWAFCKAASTVRRSRNSTALLLLCLVSNLGFFAIQLLFRYRIVRAAYFSGTSGTSAAPLVAEGLLIAYMNSLFLVLGSIASCLIYMN